MRCPGVWLISVVGIAGLIAPAYGQQDEKGACELAQSAIECARAEFGTQSALSLARAATEKIQKSPTADQSPGSASSVRDFLPTFFTSLGLGTVTESDGALTLTFNPDWLKREHAQWSLEARIHDPKPLEKLVMQAAEADRSGIKGSIEDGLEDFDDVEVTATFTHRSDRWGRDFTFHSETAATYLDQAFADPMPALQALADLLGKLGLEAQTQTFGQMRETEAGSQVADQIDAAIAGASAELEASRAALVKRLEGSSYFKYATLVDNQPQITITAKGRRRDELVGQDSFTLDVSYEWGRVNVNRFEKWCADEKRAVDLDCLSAYWTKKGTKVENLPRFKFALNWESLDDLDSSFTPPVASEPTEEPTKALADPLTLTLAGSSKAVASLSYGSYLRRDEQGNQLSRWDLEGKYEYVDDQEVRNKRYLASLTYSQRVSDSASATIGIVYASDPEFRGEVNKELSARAGLKFKLDRKE